MTEQEKIDKLCEKAEITQDEARAALEATDWDLLDAIILLEKQGRVKGAASSHSTQTDSSDGEENKEERPRFAAHASGVWSQIQRIIHIGNTNHFVITRKDREALRLPMTALVLLIVFGHLWTLAVLAIGLFCGLRYSFRGPNLGKESINNAMNRAADAAESVKNEIRSAGSEKQEKSAEEEK